MTLNYISLVKIYANGFNNCAFNNNNDNDDDNNNNIIIIINIIFSRLNHGKKSTRTDKLNTC